MLKNKTNRHNSHSELYMLEIVLLKSMASCSVDNFCRNGSGNRISVSLEITCFGTA